MTDDNIKKQLKRNTVKFEKVVDIDGNPTGEVIANVPIPHESKKLREMRKKAEKRQRYLSKVRIFERLETMGEEE